MRIYRLLLAVLAVPAIALAAPDPTRDGAAIRAVIESVESANNAGDVERWVGHFAADAVYMAPGAPAVTTREGLVEVARAGFRHAAAIDIEPVEIEVVGDWAFVRAAVTGKVTLHRSGDVVEVDVKQLVIYRRQPDGQWKIARMMSNSNQS